MTRRCSHCSNNGHNSRTCTLRSGGSGGGGCAGGGGGGAGGGGGGGGAVACVKLFGVRLTDNSIIKKSASMGNLSHYYSSSSAAASPNPSSPSGDPLLDPDHVRDGYLSDDPAHAACSSNRRSERKKGIPWTEEEHRLFLVGLQKLGKGDWRGIARNYVVSRTPTQVASHAQKYFIRQCNASRRKRRSSLFDMASDPQSMLEEQSLPPMSEMVGESSEANPDPSLDLSLALELEPMDVTSHERVEEEEEEEPVVPSNDPPTVVPAFFPAYIPVPIQLWPVLNEGGREGAGASSHEVLKPIPVLPKEPVNVDELVGLHQLSLREIEYGHVEPPDLSLKLMGSSRPSAFHANTGVSRSDVNDNKNNAIQAV